MLRQADLWPLACVVMFLPGIYAPKKSTETFSPSPAMAQFLDNLSMDSCPWAYKLKDASRNEEIGIARAECQELLEALQALPLEEQQPCQNAQAPDCRPVTHTVLCINIRTIYRCTVQIPTPSGKFETRSLRSCFKETLHKHLRAKDAESSSQRSPQRLPQEPQSEPKPEASACRLQPGNRDPSLGPMRRTRSSGSGSDASSSVGKFQGTAPRRIPSMEKLRKMPADYEPIPDPTR